MDMFLEYWVYIIGLALLGAALIRVGVVAAVRYRGIGIVSSAGGVLLILVAVIGIVRAPAYKAEDQSAKITNLETQITGLKQTIGERETEIVTLEGRIGTLEADKRKLQDDLQEANGELATARSDTEIARAQRDAAEEERDTARAERDTATASLRQVRMENTALTNERDTARRERDAARHERDRAEALTDDLWQLVARQRLSPEQLRFLDEFETRLDEINAETTVIKVRRAAFPVIGEDETLPTFEIYDSRLAADSRSLPRGYGLFRFRSESFQLEGDHGSGLAGALQDELGALICDSVASALGQTVQLDEAMGQIRELAPYDADPGLLVKLAEIRYLRARLIAETFDAEFFTRGHADGSRQDWEERLQRDMGQLRVHPVDDSRGDPETGLYFRADTVVRDATLADANGPYYTNEELPDLRAQATAALVDVLFRTCPRIGGASPARPGLLEGRVQPGFDAEDRKSRLFFRVRPKQAQP